LNFLDHTVNRNSVDMDVQDRHENADLDCRLSPWVVVSVDSSHLEDSAVGGAQDDAISGGRFAFGIPEKEKHEKREDTHRVGYGRKPETPQDNRHSKPDHYERNSVFCQRQPEVGERIFHVILRETFISFLFCMYHIPGRQARRKPALGSVSARVGDPGGVGLGVGAPDLYRVFGLFSDVVAYEV
jgi:hypothetical protein